MEGPGTPVINNTLFYTGIPTECCFYGHVRLYLKYFRIPWYYHVLGMHHGITFLCTILPWYSVKYHVNTMPH